MNKFAFVLIVMISASYALVPSLSGVVLNSTNSTGQLNTGPNLTDPRENLTAYAVGIDSSAESVVWDWRKNISGTQRSIAIINMPFEVNVSTAGTNNINSYSSVGLDGSLGGSTASYAPEWFNDPVYGGYYEFDGVNDRINISTLNTDLNLKGNETNVTITAWFRPINPGDGNYHWIFGKSINNWGIAIVVNNTGGIDSHIILTGAPTDYTQNANGAQFDVYSDTGNTLNDDEWYHVAFIIDRIDQSMYLYLDGSLVGTKTGLTNWKQIRQSINTVSSFSTIGIGEGYTAPFKGAIADVRVYNISMTADQITMLYNESYPIYNQIHNSSLRIGQSFQVCGTAVNRTDDGTAVCSNNISITDDTMLPEEEGPAGDSGKYFRFVTNYNNSIAVSCNNGNNTNTTDDVYSDCNIAAGNINAKWWNDSSASSLGTITEANFSTVYRQAGVVTDDSYTIDYGFSTGGVAQCADTNIVWRNIVSDAQQPVQTWANVSNATPIEWTNITNLCFRLNGVLTGGPDGLNIEIDSLYVIVYYSLGSGLNVTFNGPQWKNNSQRIIQNDTFILNATVKCVKGSSCGTVTAGTRYNGSSNSEPDTITPIAPTGSLHVQPPGNNQQDCGTLDDGDRCTVGFVINASGTPNIQWLADINFSADFAADNNSINVYVNISNRPPINITLFPINNTLNTSSTRDMWFLANITANHSSDVANVSLWTNQSGTWQRDKINNEGLVGYWQLSEGSGTATVDRSGNGNNGTLSAGVVWTTGMFGNGVDFDGSGGIEIAHSSTLKPATQITIEAWVNADTSSLNALREIYRKEDGSDRHLLSFQATANCAGGGGTGGCISFGIETGGTYAELDVNIDSADWENAWHHVVATYNETHKAIFRDGVQIGSVAATGAIGTSGTTPACIGAYYSAGSCGAETFLGLVDEVAIWNYARSQEQITNDYKYRYLSYFNYSFPYDSNYLWNIEVCDQWNLCIMRNQTKPDSLTLNVSAIPGITLVLPNNNTLNRTSYSNIIEYNLSGAGYVWNSSLWTNQTGWDVRRKHSDDDLLGYWQFEEGTGTVAYDSSGNGNTMTLTGNVAWNSSGKIGVALDFDGSSGYTVYTSPGVTELIGTQDFTIETWFKPTVTPTSWTALINEGASGASGFGLELQSANRFVASIGGAGGFNQHVYFTAPSSYMDGAWHHIALVYDRDDKVHGYFDGQEVGTGTDITGNTGSIARGIPLSFGRYSGSIWYFNGTLDEVQISKYAKSATEIMKDYTNGYNTYWNHTFGLDTDYLWNIQVCNKRGDCKYSPVNRTLNLSVIPTINLVGPADSSTNVTSKRIIWFTFNTSMAGYMINSSLWNNESGWSFKKKTNTEPSILRYYWQFAEGTGTTTMDASGNDNTGTLTSGAKWNSSGRYGYGISFEKPAYVVTASVSQSFLNKQYTQEAWIKPEGLSGGGATGAATVIRAMQGGVFDNGIVINWTSLDAGARDKVTCGAYSSGWAGQYVIGTSNIVKDTWHHVACTYNGSHLAVYVNGTRENTLAINAPGAGTAAWNIGRYPGALEYFNGTIDEVAIYNYSKSDEEIANDFNYRYGSSLNYTFGTLQDFLWNAQVCNFREECFFASANYTIKVRGLVTPETCAAYVNATDVTYRNFTDYNITIRSQFGEEIVSSPLRVCWA